MVTVRKPSWDGIFPREVGPPEDPVPYKIGSAAYLSCEAGKPLGWQWAVADTIHGADKELRKLLGPNRPRKFVIWCRLWVQSSPQGVLAIWPAFLHSDCLRWYDGYVCVPEAGDVLTAIQLQAYPGTLPEHLPTPYEILRPEDRVAPAGEEPPTDPHFLGG